MHLYLLLACQLASCLTLTRLTLFLYYYPILILPSYSYLTILFLSYHYIKRAYPDWKPRITYTLYPPPIPPTFTHTPSPDLTLLYPPYFIRFCTIYLRNRINLYWPISHEHIKHLGPSTYLIPIFIKKYLIMYTSYYIASVLLHL